MKQRSRATWVVGALWLLIAFGVLAFGAVYKWAYQPLLVSAAIVGAYGLLIGAAADRRVLRPMMVMNAHLNRPVPQLSLYPPRCAAGTGARRAGRMRVAARPWPCTSSSASA